MWWVVDIDGRISWTFSSASSVPNARRRPMVASSEINAAGDRNTYLSSASVPIFVAYTAFSTTTLPDGSQIRIGTTPTTERPNPYGAGMVRFDEWLVHHVRGTPYGSMAQNYGAPACLHPNLASVLNEIGLQASVDYRIVNGQVQLTRSGEWKITPWHALYGANRGNYDGVPGAETFVAYHLRVYGVTFDDQGITFAERYARFADWASGAGYVVPP
jgi:hypothetical protein